MNDWVKRLGQWHIYSGGSSQTACGKPMLGNNYARYIAMSDRVQCPDCFKTDIELDYSVREENAFKYDRI